MATKKAKKKAVSSSSHLRQGFGGQARPSKSGFKVRPLGDKVLVAIEENESASQTKSGIIIPETVSKERPETGRVVAVGEGRRLDNGQLVPVKVKPGDKVIFSKYGPDEIKVDDKEYLIVSESNILAVIV